MKLVLESSDSQDKKTSVMEIKIENANSTDNGLEKCPKTSLLAQSDRVYRECSETLERPTSDKLCNKMWQRLVQAMDLELLNDLAFWSIIIGMALVYTSTINFTMVFPSFLQVIKKHTSMCAIN